MNALTIEEVLSRDRDQREGQHPQLLGHTHVGKETHFHYPDRVWVTWWLPSQGGFRSEVREAWIPEAQS